MVTNDKFRDHIDKMYDTMREHEEESKNSSNKSKKNKKNGKGNNSPQNDLQSQIILDKSEIKREQ